MTSLYTLSMKRILKLSFITFSGLSLTACAYTSKTLENSYRSKARKECSLPTGGSDSIHQRQSSSCADGIYVPKKRSTTY